MGCLEHMPGKLDSVPDQSAGGALRQLRLGGSTKRLIRHITPESSARRTTEKPGKPTTLLYDKQKESVGRPSYRERMRAPRQKKSGVRWRYVTSNPPPTAPRQPFYTRIRGRW